MAVSGTWLGKNWLAAVGVGGFAFGVGRLLAWRRAVRAAAGNVGLPVRAEPAESNWRPPAAPAAKSSDDISGLIEQMLAEGRYALLLRPQLAPNLDKEQLARTLAALSAGMSLTPEGEVALLGPEAALSCDNTVDQDHGRFRPQVVHVDGFCLDRYPITNRQYYMFLAAGGYEQTALWEPEIQPIVVEFVDQSGCLGPRFWRGGHYARGAEDHPVVGVNWYEASAYARWAGKRLPNDAEWVKAACWPVPVGGGGLLQRRFPWGDAMVPGRANIWTSAVGTTLPVHELPEGASVGGVYHLSGNVWQWIAGQYAGEDQYHPHGLGASTQVFKSLRGGAFDTYFDAQATCQFQSGERPLARKHNIGFRCALSLCDLASQSQPQDESNHIEGETNELAEVGA
jgi:iron(II)-dependent oxidoreductase